GNSVEMSMWLPKKTHLLGWAESLRRSGAELPVDFDQRVDLMTQKWNQLQKILAEHSGSCSPLQDPRVALSPQTNCMVRQLEDRIKELKGWLRDTELLIFNTCLRQDTQPQASTQLQNFKSLCLEVRGRRKGVASVLRLCQRLLEQGEQHREALQVGPVAQLHQGALQMGPEAEQHQEALQLLAINLERRWEAIVMQALQWQTRLKRVLGPEQVPGNFLEPALMDLHGAPPEDSWEWDEMDMTIADTHDSHTHTPDLDSDTHGPQPSGLGHCHPLHPSTRAGDSVMVPPPSSHHPVNTVYQVYSVHNIELYCQPHFPSPLPKTLSHEAHRKQTLSHEAHRKQTLSHEAHRKQTLLKSLSKDSSFSSVESLPDLLGAQRGRQGPQGGDSARRLESESGIVSEGDTETTANSETCQLEEMEGEGEEGRGSHHSPPRGSDSPSEDRVCDEDIDRILERANQCALYGDCVVLKRDPRSKSGRKRREDSEREMRRKRENRENRKNRDESEEARRKKEQVEMRRKHQRDTVEILVNGHGFTPDSDSEGGFGSDGASIPGGDKQEGGVTSGQKKNLRHRVFSPLPLLSQGSSLESLFTAGELFPAGKDPLPRSISLESWLAPGRSGEEMGSQGSLGELGPGEPGKPGEAGDPAPAPGGEAAGELSRRTLELLRRLEDIQSPLAQNMTRSISDITLQGCSLRLPAPGGRAGRRGPPSSVNESSAASLTELSSAEESSAASEDLALLKSRLFPDTNASFRKRCQRAGAAPDETDASVSMVVNVSCASACTDDEDDSDLLSSSTPTLTEEELVGREGEESNMTSEEEEEDEEEEEEGTEESFALGLEYMRNELQSWIKPRPPSSSCSPAARERGEADLGDELQCGTSSQENASSPAGDRRFLGGAALKLLETNANVRSERVQKQPREGEVEANRRNATRSYISRLVDDMENGNVDQSQLKRKDEEDELLMREEGSLYTRTGEACKDSVGGDSRNAAAMMTTCSSSPSCELLPLENKQASLESQLRGEIPCHSSSHPSPSLSPVEDCRSHHALLRGGGRQAINSQETFSSFLREESRRQPASYALGHAHPRGRPSCCGHAPSSSDSPGGQKKGENVHNFVMEIIDMTTVALRNKENQSEQQGLEEGGGSSPPPLSSAQLAQIRDKVLEHSHRPIQLRKGDFYSYLSLSSHDSDCGEVSTCQESKNNTPLLSNTPDLPPAISPSPDLPPPLSPTLDLQDQELLFEACTEEVYLGPPLCYSMVLTKRPRRRPSPNLTDSFLSCHLGPSPIPTETFLCDNRGPRPQPTANPDSYLLGPCPSAGARPVLSPAQSAEAAYQGLARTAVSPGSPTSSLAAPSRNEPASYLNPSRCESQIDTVECFADSKTLESNIAPVMTKISISCSSTNPLKEAGCASINPKINSAAMRGCDSGETGSAALWMKQRNVRNGRNSLQDAKATQKQAPRSGVGSVEGTRGPQGGSHVTDRSSASSRPQVRRLSGAVAPVPATAQL
ncbi:A-kinase anchor protein 6-like, partial [Osmerus mordax]|uniref:A-kinase anchor protein 6-like n=1 Tax=Osmerus mordax TaxID=8014 RepID=UPI00350F04EE